MDFINKLYEVNPKSLAVPYGVGKQDFSRLAKYMDIAFKGLKDNTISALEVSKALYIINTEELYKDYPVPGTNNAETFHNFFSFVESIFGARKSTAYANLKIFERFSPDSSSPDKVTLENVYSYTYTQLSLMVNLPISDLSKIYPSMTCSQIKKIVKEVKARDEAFSNRLENQEDEDFSPSKLGFLLNNDKARLELLDLYEKWDKQKEIEVLGNKLAFYSLELSDRMTLFAIHSSNDEYSDVSYYLVGNCGNAWSYSVNRALVLGNPASKSKVVNYLRDVKIISVIINK